MNRLTFSILLLGMIMGTASAGLTIQQGQAAVLVYNGITSGGTPPYSYQWFYECPSCSFYISIPNGPGPSYYSNSVVYYWNTTTATAAGTWNFIIQGKDSASGVFNSMAVPVNVVVPASGGGGGTQATTTSITTILTTTTVAPTTTVGVIGSAMAWIKPMYALTFIQTPDWILASVALMVVTIVVRNEKKDSRAYWVPALALVMVVALYFIA
jgi:hypothetical protein